MTIRKALQSMNYREVEPGRWLKPVGYHLFSYEENRGQLGEWTSWYKGVDGKIGRMDVRKTHFSNVFLNDLKEWEAYARTNVVGDNGPSEFHLYSADYDALL